MKESDKTDKEKRLVGYLTIKSQETKAAVASEIIKLLNNKGG